MDGRSLDSVEAAMVAYSEISTKILHILTSALVVFPLLFTVSFWPLVLNPRNPAWVSVHLGICVVYAVVRFITIVSSIYSAIRMKHTGFLTSYVIITWIGIILDFVGIAFGLIFLEYPDSGISKGIILAYVDRYIIQKIGYSNFFYIGVGCLLFYLLQLVLDLTSICIANKVIKLIRNKPILVYPADESFELQMQIRIEEREISV